MTQLEHLTHIYQTGLAMRQTAIVDDDFIEMRDRFDGALLGYKKALENGEITATLSFAALRAANSARLPQFKNCHGETAHSKADGSDWTPAQWLQATVGELGEYANKRKKFERGDLTAAEFAQEAADELADVVIYLDLLAKQLGVDLSTAIPAKFNRTSAKVGCDVRL